MTHPADALRAAAAAADAEQSQEPIPRICRSCATRRLVIKVVGDRMKPYAAERVRLHLGSGRTTYLEATTDADGVASWDGLPDGDERFRVQLVDVLESWPARWGPSREATEDDIPKPWPYAAKDAFTHPVRPQPEVEENLIVVNRLTELEKLSHFMDAYEDNKARYDISSPSAFEKKPPRWHWGKGSVCNQHVNFFLGYWFNYNDDFTADGATTVTDALPTFTAKKQHVWPKRNDHRGYKEFLLPVTGGEVLYHHVTLKRDIEYFWVHKHFALDATPRTDLFDKLGWIAFYSLSDEVGSTTKVALVVSRARAWLAQNPSHLPGRPKPGAEAQRAARGLDAAAVLRAVEGVSAQTPEGKQLFADIMNDTCEIFDHHAGIIYKKPDGQLHTFSANGSLKHLPGPYIQERDFSGEIKKRTLFCMAFWRPGPLRPGGYAPVFAEKNEGPIGVDNPSRFIQWEGARGGDGGGQKPSQRSTKRRPKR